MNLDLARRSVALMLLLLASSGAPALAAPTAELWQEIGRSASGSGISASELGVVPEHRNTSVVIGPDQRPIVAYTDWADIVVRRWNGSSWEIIAQPGGGHLPQLAVDSSGRMYLAWMSFVADSDTWEVYLLTRDSLAEDWHELGGSATGGGISAADGPANPNSFSLALAPDGRPWVAYDTTPTAGADFTTETSGIARASNQVYVKRWAGPAQGWIYVGSGRAGGGASHVPSFAFTNGDGSANVAVHGALSPTIAIRPDGTPVVAFLYTTAFTNGDAGEFNGVNDDLYAVRWNGAAWVPMGPAVPASAAGAGLGAPGGISQSGGWSVEAYLNRMNRPQLVIGRDGAPVVGWGETTATDDSRRMYVRRWSGTAWEGLGSPTGEIDAAAMAFDIALTPGVNGPLAAWSAGSGTDSSILVLGYDARTGAWAEVGRGSATGAGISGPTRHAFTPWIAVDAAGTPTVAWIDAPDTESGGQAFVRTIEPRNLPDLTVTALTVPATARTGGTIAVASTVRNIGGSVARGAVVSFYLGTGTVRDAADVALGSRTVGAVGVNGTSTATTSLTLPATVAPGVYHLLAVVDEVGAVSERGEDNNVRASSTLTVALFRPDLALDTVAVPAIASPGRSLPITSVVRNLGIAPAGPTAIRFFLSSDETLDAGDVLLGTRALAPVRAGGTRTAHTTVTLPADTPMPATYHMIGIVDVPEDALDLDGTNNARASAPLGVVAYQPDLAITSLATPATGAAGRPLAISHTVRNGGPAPAAGFVVRFLLSSDDRVDGAVLLGSRSIRSLAPGAASSAVTRLKIPAETAVPATYRVVAVVDPLAQQTELDEANNVTLAADTIALTAYRPDLALTTVGVPATGAVGRPLATIVTVQNAGPAPAGAFTVRLVLSADDTLDPGDVALGSRRIDGLAAHATRRVTVTVSVPAATAPGSYHVIGVVEAPARQAELDATNNALASASAVALAPYRPDLVLSAVGAPATAAAGQSLAVTHTTRNRGAAPTAGAFVISLYLSADATLDDDDVLLGTRTIAGALAAGAARTDVTRIVVPAGTAVPPTYHVIGVVDSLERQRESDEGNNTAVSGPIASSLAQSRSAGVR